MKQFKSLMCILFVFLFTNTSWAQGDAEKIKESFKKGILKDFTPKEITSKSILVNESGPFFMVVGIERRPHQLDVRPEGEREKIKFTLADGSGDFALLKSPNDRTTGELLTTPDWNGMVVVLFFPSSKSIGKDCAVHVSAVGNSGVSGALTFKFSGVKIDKIDLSKLCSKFLETDEKSSGFPPKDNMKILRSTYDDKGEKIIKTEEKYQFCSLDSNGNYEYRENNESGKILSKGNTKFKKVSPCERGLLWADSKESLVFISNPKDNLAPTQIWEFDFYDKLKFTLHQIVVLSPNMVTIVNMKYQNKSNVQMLRNKKTQIGSLWRNKEKLVEIIHSLK